MFIYLHVPFCVSRCIYCDFFVLLQKHGGQEQYLDAVLREIDARFSTLKTPLKPIQALYVGGGTPSLLSAQAYQQVFARLNRYVPFADEAEITLEANPTGSQSAMADDPAAYLAVGFNRISVGVQSFNNVELKKLSRSHTAEDAEAFIRGLRQAGWSNISLDLMYGLPLQTLSSWHDTIERAIALDVEHISMYGLKVEDGTPLARLSTIPGDTAGYRVAEDDEAVQMYFDGLSRLEKAGYRRYEISNLAKPGRESHHNLNYWRQGDWLALGPSAHGHMHGELYENVRDLPEYLVNPTTETSRTRNSPAEQLENRLIFGLRLAEGVHIPSLEAEFNIDFRKQYASILKRFEGEFLEWQGDHLQLMEKAIPYSHHVLCEFIQ